MRTIGYICLIGIILSAIWIIPSMFGGKGGCLLPLSILIVCLCVLIAVAVINSGGIA